MLGLGVQFDSNYAAIRFSATILKVPMGVLPASTALQIHGNGCTSYLTMTPIDISWSSNRAAKYK